MTCNRLAVQLKVNQNLISRSAKTERVVEINVQAPIPHVGKSRPRLNLALVLDRSGSMSGQKLAFVKQAANHVLDQMKPLDQITLVTYDDTIQVLARSINVTTDNRFELKHKINSIQSGNMTNLEGGWVTGCREIAQSAQEETINRTFLLTDGLANIGETDTEILSAHAFELYQGSISTSTFGVGEGFNEHLLEPMANRGGGSFYYIADPGKISDIFLKEFNNLVGITARKVEIQLDLPQTVEWRILGGWPAEYKNERLHIFVGDMLTGKEQPLYLLLQIPGDEKASNLGLKAKVFGQAIDNAVLEGQSEITFNYASQQDVDTAAIDNELMARFSEVELADTATEALKLERRGERVRSSQLLRMSIERNRPHMAPEAAAASEKLANEMLHGLTEKERKSSHWEMYNLKRQKVEDEKRGKDKENNPS